MNNYNKEISPAIGSKHESIGTVSITTPFDKPTAGIFVMEAKKYKGVSLVKDTGKWQSQYNYNGKHYYCGKFNNQKIAYAAYLLAVEERNKDLLSIINYIDGEDWVDVPWNTDYMISNYGRVASKNYRRTGVTSLCKAWITHGYEAISITAKQRYYVHRLVWSSFNGTIPDGVDVNHINSNKLDNRLVNLELCSRRENVSHSKIANGSKCIGARFDKAMLRWKSQITFNRVQHHLGYFDTQKEARDAYLSKLIEIGEVNKYAFKTT